MARSQPELVERFAKAMPDMWPDASQRGCAWLSKKEILECQQAAASAAIAFDL
jgi:hypothetical protein